MIKAIYRSLATYVRHRWGTFFFPLFFCVDAVFFMPVNVVLALFCLERREHAYLYALGGAAASVLGAAIAYFVGAWLFGSIGIRIIEAFSSMETFNNIINWYRTYQSGAVLFASFAPIPFKLVTLSAGFCHLPLLPFLFFVFLGRGIRFLLIAGLTKAYGPQILEFIDKYFKYFAIASALATGVAFIFLR